MNAITRTFVVDVVAGPFRRAEKWVVPLGVNCAWLVEKAPELITRDPKHVVVVIGGQQVPAAMWQYVRPKGTAPVAVIVSPKDDDAFALASTALQISSALVGFVNPLAGVGLAVGGGLILEAFRPKPKAPGLPQTGGSEPVVDTSAGSSINLLQPDQQIPGVAGEIRVTLPLLAPSYIDIDGDKEVAHILAGVQGATDLQKFELNDADIANFSESVTFNVDNGLSGEAPKLTIYDKIVIQEQFDERFDIFRTDPTSVLTPNRRLIDQSNPTERPAKIIKTSGQSPDEIWLHFLLPDGFRATDSSVSVGTAFTIELRLKDGGSFRKLPYIRMIVPASAQLNRPFRFYVRLKFEADPGGIPTNIGTPWDEMLSTATVSASQLDDDLGNQEWVADPYFDDGGTDQALHVAEFDDGLEIYLDPDDATNPWPKGEYEVRVDKGFTVGQNNLQSTLQGDAIYHNVFDNAGILILPNASETNDNICNMVWQRIASVWNEAPVTAPDLAYIEMRAAAIRVDRLTALACGYTNVFNGTDWNARAVSKDPAAWYRRSLTDKYHARPLPLALLDDTSLQAWSVDNAAKSYEFNAVLENGVTVEDVLRFTTIAGLAKTLRSSKWGVWIDKDRTAETPTMLLTPENSAGFENEKELENIPDALRITYRDRDNEYRRAEKLIDNTGTVVDTGTIIEAIDGEKIGKTSLAEARFWAKRLLLERQNRQTFRSIRVPARSLAATRGDLIGLTHDVISKRASYGIVEKVFEDGAGNAIGLRLNNRLRLSEATTEDIFEPPDVFDVADIFNVSDTFGVAIELTDQTVRTERVNEIIEADVVTFTTPFTKPDTLKEGVWVGSGPLGEEFKRLIITNIQPAEDESAQLVMVDEAPSIH